MEYQQSGPPQPITSPRFQLKILQLSWGVWETEVILCGRPLHRHLPVFHLCRPLVELSKKELALFRVFECLPILPTRPFFFHEDLLPCPLGAPVRNPHPSVRLLLQDFLIELQRDKSATVHNLLSVCRKLEPAFSRWGKTDIRRPQK